MSSGTRERSRVSREEENVGPDKVLSEMSTEEILAEIARLRERRAINRVNASAKSKAERTPKIGGGRRTKVIEEISDDLESLLG